MEKSKTVEAYYEKEASFKKEINRLREVAQKTEAVETCKWGMPVYTIDNKNVFGICRFKDFFGVWFFNGVFLKDPKKVLRNAQEGKTKAMRHWNFTKAVEIDEKGVLAYMNEAIINQKEGKIIKPTKPKQGALEIPNELRLALSKNAGLKKSFSNFTPYKQKEFCEYISEAKQEATKLRRVTKVLPLIENGVGLNDKYR